MAQSPWPTIAAERSALIGDLAPLTAQHWETPSLCAGWTVHRVTGHMVATAKTTPVLFFTRFVRARFKFDDYIEKAAAEQSAAAPAALLAEFRAVAGSTTAPPGPKDGWLGEVLVHGEDIRRPLGIAHAYPLPWVTRAIEFYAGSNMVIGGKSRVAGVTLQATDTDWSHGQGPVVAGPAMSLLMATAGRRVALDDLTGPGLDTLRR